MYEEYSRQALPEKDYRELLGSAICAFNSNNAFIIENVIRVDIDKKYNWFELIDFESGRLKKPIKETICRKSNNEDIADEFDKIVSMRNRIIHSFQITDKNGKQILATKDRNGNQFIITKEYLFEFIKRNEFLASKLHEFREY